jgi:hypothetical protein
MNNTIIPITTNGRVSDFVVSESVSNDGGRQSCPPSDALPVNVSNQDAQVQRR